ncbi:hypothetical protein PH505_bb00330 [Pseudoalteromonas distincta]|uniref:hypothetical protein n=1 Tax=Pseudoalteromonas distincta TaxID=77608 RepID=UPI00020A0BC6|nr:hypothetical protein [Pseudoalteromonas distincta]EGI72885.1 hypothetical protein PH505_bb00330 [Pseudoalteromonas distincta]
MDNKTKSQVSDSLQSAHSLAVLLARASEDDLPTNHAALQIAQLIDKSVNALGDQ